ncbi:MAG: Sporulation initiation inhibitor protein Soj [Candidatus Dichloromethanomonas elyunquensis]|nr:MAG: Sporulation initiation inhibitor protein Soj [Candidatus Dichloromethanomonas elyunquensis]
MIDFGSYFTYFFRLTLMITYLNFITEGAVSLQTIAIATQKGGTGKTTTAQALGIGLSLKGYQILFIDLDPQGNLSYILGASQQNVTAYEMLTGKIAMRKVICKIDKKVSIIASSPLLSGIDPELKKTDKEFLLKKNLEAIKAEYDYLIIDSPPSLGILTVNALAASNHVIIPAQADIFSLQGIGQLYSTVETVKKYCNPNLAIKGILLTRYNNRSILSRDLTDLIKETAQKLDTFVYQTVIRESITIKEAQASKKDIFSYAPRNNVTKDYSKFIEEYLNIKE